MNDSTVSFYLKKDKNLNILREASPEIQKEYIKLVRAEEKLVSKELRNGRVYLNQDFEEVLKNYPDCTYIPGNSEEEKEDKKEKLMQHLLYLLDMGLHLLQWDNPLDYQLIHEYYLGTRRITIDSLTYKYSLTYSQVRNHLKLARDYLKEFILRFMDRKLLE